MQELQRTALMYRLGIRLHSAFVSRDVQINFKRIYADKTKPYVFFKVDAAGLPSNIQPNSLIGSDVEQFLSIALGYQVRAINGKGLTYCVKC
jgi:hypothetical protein